MNEIAVYYKVYQKQPLPGIELEWGGVSVFLCDKCGEKFLDTLELNRDVNKYLVWLVIFSGLFIAQTDVGVVIRDVKDNKITVCDKCTEWFRATIFRRYGNETTN